MNCVDLNCDMGELPEHIADGTQESLLPYLTSVNIACGGHAGNEAMMRATIEQALRFGVAIGAHPGYADRAHFGRIELRISHDELSSSISGQVSLLGEIAAALGATVSHVKPHGALYNRAARDPEVSRAFAKAIARWRQDVILVGLAGSAMLREFQEAGFLVAAEAFADRRYEADGSLRARKFDDALIVDPAKAAEQAVHIVRNRSVMACNGAEIPLRAQTLCIHADTPGAPQIAAAVASALREASITTQGLRAQFLP